MGKFENKWLRAAMPALFIHCSIGTVYCWSLVSEDIATYIGSSKSAVEWAFSLAIFFLGMSAAFLGNVVEKDIHKSSLIATIFFALGMAGTGFFIQQKSLLGILLSYGVIMGIGLGTGYLSPVKTLMLWFKEQKGLATGLAVAGFGLAKVIASPLIEYLKAEFGLVMMFYILAALYFVLMFIGHLLLKKPGGWVEEHDKHEKPVLSVFKNKTFVGIWIMFFLNITCGLALISQEKGIVKAMGLAAMVSVISSLTAIFNATGRLGFSAWADRLKDRNTVYKLIFILCIGFTAVAVVTQGIVNSIPVLIIPLLFMVNAGYGGGFSNVPTLLSDHFGMKTISQVHGLVLSAWAFAGLAGNQLASFIVNHTGSFVEDSHGNKINPVGYQNVLYATLVLYVIALFVSYVMVGKAKKEKEA
jgi:MFS family permease